MHPHYEVQLAVFEGPMDLLLQLIEREELDITTVALAQVTDQYLAHVASLEEREARDLADFLTVAAKLVFIKSAALLSRPSEATAEADEVGQELVDRLKLYRRFKELAGVLHRREELGLYGYVRIAPLPEIDPELDVDQVSLDDLLTLVQEALNAVPAAPIGEVVAPITVTIDQQISRIQNELIGRRQVEFREVLSGATSRLEIIVTLLAVLELIKQDQVRVRQERLFGEIVIERQLPVETGPPEPSDAGANPAA